MHSLKLALRSVLRSPGFTLVVVLSLGLGVGACTVVFSMFRSVYAYEAPYPEAERLVEIASTQTTASWQRVDIVPLERVRAWMRLDWRTLEAFAARATTSMVLDVGEPENVPGELVSGKFFEIMRVPALEGRWLTPADDEPLAEPAAVISQSLWEDKLGSEKSAIGSVIKVSGNAYTVVGVMPEAFAAEPRVWLPAPLFLESSFVAAWLPVGRLRDGATLRQAANEFHAVAAAEVAADSTLYNGYGAVAVPLVDPRAELNNSGTWITIASVLGVLILAATNLGVLFLVRGSERGRSAGIRLTLGASAWQLGRGMLIESLLFAVGGTIAAGMLAFVWQRLLSLWTGAPPAPLREGMDVWTIVFAVALSFGIAVLVGSEPIRHILRLDLRGLMQGATTSSLGPRERVTRNVLVGTQVGLAMTFASVGVVLSIAFTRFSTFDIGYDARRIAVALPDYPLAQIATEVQPAVMREYVERIAANPLVESVSMWRYGLQRFPPKPEIDAVFDGGSTEILGRSGLYRFYEVDLGFFETFQIPIIQGRDFAPSDDAGSPAVGIISEGGATKWWPNQNPIGKQLKLGEKGEWITVVGVSADAAAPIRLGRAFSDGLLQAQRNAIMPMLYRPLAQGGSPPEGWIIEGAMQGLDGIVVGARAKSEVPSVVAMMRAELASVLPNLPLDYGGSLHDWQVNVPTGRLLKLYRGMLATLAAAAVFLSLLGVIGIVSDGVVRRTREVGIRKALGARTADVIVVLVREGFLTTLLGVITGVGLVVALGKIVSSRESLSSLLGGRGLADWPVLASVAAALVAAALLAACLCTSRANRMEASVALRSE